MKFSRKEIRDLFLAWIVLSVAFAVLFSPDFNNFTIFFLISALTAGIGFLFHELMHKYVAQKYGLFAEFKAFYGGLLLAVGLAFFGFIFAAPGAVYINGYITRERNGKISVAGPITNIVLAIGFLLPILLLGNVEGVLGLFFSLGFRINALLAVFNMIPVLPLDGAKVMAWDKKMYWITTGIALALFLGSWVI